MEITCGKAIQTIDLDTCNKTYEAIFEKLCTALLHIYSNDTCIVPSTQFVMNGLLLGFD